MDVLSQKKIATDQKVANRLRQREYKDLLSEDHYTQVHAALPHRYFPSFLRNFKIIKLPGKVRKECPYKLLKIIKRTNNDTKE